MNQHWQRVYTGTVTIKNDTTQESAETFHVVLTKSGAPAVTLAIPSAFVVTIRANDALPASTDASLSGLSLSGVTLSPAFSSATTSYTASVANSVSSITVTATQNHAAATVAITPDDANASASGHQVSLNVGSNTVTVKVTAEDRTTSRTYTLTVTRAAPPALTALTVSSGTLTPAFDGDTLAYTVPGVPTSVSRITVTATAESNATVSYLDGSDAPLADADPAADGQQVDLAEGENVIKIKVTKDGTASQTYTLTVTRAADSAAPQPTIELDPDSTDFRLVVSFGEGVSGFDESDLTLSEGWSLVSGSLEEDADEAGTYRVGFRPERELGGLEADLTVTLPVGAASDLAANANASEAATVTEAGLYAGPAAIVYLKPFEEDGTYDPDSLGGEFRVGFLFMRDHIIAAPVTGFDATDIALTNASVKVEGGAPAFIAKPPRGLYGAEPIEPDSDEYAGSYLYEAIIVPDATACASGCEITVGVPYGAALGAISAAESDLTHLVRPNVAAEPLTVQREAAGSGVRVSALTIRQAVNSDVYWVDVLISGDSQDFEGYIQLAAGGVEQGTIEMTGSSGGLNSFWARPSVEGPVTLSIDLDRDGTYGEPGVDFSYLIGTATAQARSQDDETAGAKAAEPATIPDAALRGILERVLGKEAGAAITTEELAALRLLDLRGSGAADLAGLEHAVGLTDLYLDDLGLDLSPLERLRVTVHGAAPAPSTDAALSGLELTGAPIAFDPDTTGYAASVANDVTETTVTATTRDGGASYAVMVDGVEDGNGTVPLAEGSNVIAVEVTAEDGETTKTYTVTVTRAAPPLSTDAALSGLTLSSVDFGNFDPATTGYTADVDNGVTETTVTATVNDDGAVYLVKLDGAPPHPASSPALALGSPVQSRPGPAACHSPSHLTAPSMPGPPSGQPNGCPTDSRQPSPRVPPLAYRLADFACRRHCGPPPFHWRGHRPPPSTPSIGIGTGQFSFPYPSSLVSTPGPHPFGGFGPSPGIK